MNNLIIPQNEGVGKGILAQVPWHKHGAYVYPFSCIRRRLCSCLSFFFHYVCVEYTGWVDMRLKYDFCEPKDHEAVLPIVIVRDPYYWYVRPWNLNKASSKGNAP